MTGPSLQLPIVPGLQVHLGCVEDRVVLYIAGRIFHISSGNRCGGLASDDTV